MKSAIFFISLLFELGLVSAFPANTTEDYPFSQTLVDGSYIVFWKHDDTRITFETHVKTLGWIGFGISDNGNMFPADVVIGWVKDGVAFLEDRHTEQYGMPLRDDKQDWRLVLGKEYEDTTVLKFERALDTCDTDGDKPITKDLVHIIFAWHDSDPDPTPNKHTMKGSKTVYLLDPVSQDGSLPPDAKSFLFTSLEARLPTNQTYYHCTAYKFPTLEHKHHAVVFEPVIEAGNEDITHHFVLSLCVAPFSDAENGTSYDCTGRGQPPAFATCYIVYTAWATGGKTYYLPENVGMVIGEANSSNYFILQVHYNNDLHQEGRVDSSGFRVWYTPTLRTFEAAVIQVGMQVNALQAIPPHYKAFVNRGYCSSACLSEGMGDNGALYVTAVFLHSHLLGRKLRLRHVRNGEELEPISEDNGYDFDFQQTRVLRTPRTVLPTDTLIMECVYDSTEKVDATRGGLGTSQEMCLAFVFYYPKMSKVSGCASYPTYNVGHDQGENGMYQKISQILKTNDWNNPLDRNQFQCFVDGSEQNEVCYGNSYWHFRFAPVFKIEKPYVAESTCPGVSKDSATIPDPCDTSSSTVTIWATDTLIAASILILYL